MSTERFKLRLAMFLLLVRDGKVLLARRANTGWMDRKLSLISGHADGGEPARQAMAREALEEGGIVVRPEDLRFVLVEHHSTDIECINLYFQAESWEGEPRIMEPDKCSQMLWAPLDGLPDDVIPSVKEALQVIASGNAYTEYGW